jgi:nitrite reductase/ring-hydroxylating ferredoxin subunit
MRVMPRFKPGHDRGGATTTFPSYMPADLSFGQPHPVRRLLAIAVLTVLYMDIPRADLHPRTGTASGAAEAGREELLRMAEKLVGKVSEFKDGDRRIVFLGDHEIGVFRENGTFYAYSNYCLHQGGPACEGLTIAKVEERIMPDKTSKGLYFSDTELHFVCPWHGYEYDIKTGECVSDRKLKLRKYEVIEKGDEVYVRA